MLGATGPEGVLEEEGTEVGGIKGLFWVVLPTDEAEGRFDRDIVLN